MFNRIRDPVGTGVALLVGLAFGVALSAPMLSDGIPTGGLTLGRLEVTLMVGGLVLVAAPATLLLVYLFFSEQ